MAENRRICTSCGMLNEEDARFCEGCGGSLARLCTTCELEASATARFCRGCGSPLDAEAAPTGLSVPVRKTVTVMFADLAGSTTFEEQVDAETAREVIGRYHDLLRTTAQRHRAGVTKYIGDGFMAVWGVPEIGPDDAAHAIDAAVELQDHFVGLAARVAETHGAQLALRVAVNTGEVVVGAGDADLIGDALNVGARLEAECPRGRVVVGEETWRSTRNRYRYESLGRVPVKGRSAPVAVYQWLERRSDATDAAPFVGRTQEVRRLQAVLDDAVAARAARLVTVIGDPGVGKSRLAAEFIQSQSDTVVFRARCADEGTVALAPIVEVLRTRDLDNDVPASVPERERLLRDLNGLTAGVPGSVEENFWALRRFVEVLAWRGAVLLVFDDVQWADTLLLDFIEHVVEWSRQTPVLVMALGRPELRELRPDLVTVGKGVSEAVHLGGLDAAATAALAAEVLGAARVPDELLRRLPSSTGGNPLFVRELIGMLAHDGVLVEQPTGWQLTIDVDAITIPPTIHALLASRLERLEVTDRRVLEIASVIGSDFSLGAVRTLAGVSNDRIKSSINRLRRLELAHPSGTYVGDEPVWRFHHILIRDVAYRRLLKSDRADLHEQLAQWVESGESSVAYDTDEMAARHLEAAYTYRRELGNLDERTKNLALRAARHYAASARRALDRDELVSAGNQAARGAALADADPAAHAELLLIGCEAFLSAGDVTAGAPLVDQLDRVAGDALAPWATCYRCQFVVYTDPKRLQEAEARLQDAIDEFSGRMDPLGLAKAHRVRAGARARLGRVGDCECDLFDALIAARQSGDHRQITAALSAAPSAALWGPSPVPKAGGRCLDVVRMQRMTTAAPSLEATSMRHLAVLEMLRGRPDKAMTMLTDARQIVADLGLRHGLMETELFAGIIESMKGDPVAAEPHFRTALEGLDALGVGADAGLAAALLAKSLLAQSRIDEADRYATESEDLAGRNLKSAIAWRTVRGEILAAQGRYQEAVTVARQAVTVAAETDLVLDHAEACLALSRVLAAGRDAKGANGARGEAERLYAAKEVTGSIGPRAQPAVATASIPTTAGLSPSRLATTNQSCEFLPPLHSALQALDVESAVRCFAERFVYDDRRRLGRDAVVGLEAMRAAVKRVFEQYRNFEFRVLAVRGAHLHLLWSRWTDDCGNETTTLYVNQTDDSGLVIYHGRFDEDDFEGAYRELERRYSAAEGVEYAEAGATAAEWILASNKADLGTAFDDVSCPDLRFEDRRRWGYGDRSAAGIRANQDLNAMATSAWSWNSALHWLSPNWLVSRAEREAFELDGEKYTWTWLAVTEIRDGQFASMCLFEIDDEEAAFAYAKERARAVTSRLAVSNRASENARAFVAALNAGDIDRAMKHVSDQCRYDDRRRLGSSSFDEMPTALARVLEQYSYFEMSTLAVRGERLHLLWSRWSDDAGNETAHLHVQEIDAHGQMAYDGRFDEDDFEGAYRELERRYYAGEAAGFGEWGAVGTEMTLAFSRGDFDRIFGELTTPDFRIESRAQSIFGERSAAELRASSEELLAMVASSRLWHSAICWVSPNVGVARNEREAVGHDGETYSWARLYVFELRAGRVAMMCEFGLDDEEAAFAHAEERMRTSASRLAVTNHSCETVHAVNKSLRSHDVDAIMECMSDALMYDDRRQLSGDPISDRDEFRVAFHRILQQYNHFEYQILAVRGDRLNLHLTRWSDDAGNETAYLHIVEVDDDGRQVYEGRFDEDDFEGAYRELDRRYYSGEGAAFAGPGSVLTDWVVAVNLGDFDHAFGEIVSPRLHIENRSRAPFRNRSAAEARAAFESLNTVVASMRLWVSVVCWLSPTLLVLRTDRDAAGSEGKEFASTWLSVTEIHDGQVLSVCSFDVDDEEAAFAYAGEKKQAFSRRLAIDNKASRTRYALGEAMRAGDADGAADLFADGYVYDDHWEFGGNSPDDVVAACERILEPYTLFEGETLAVRGDSVQLSRTRWFNDSGYETCYLHVLEVDDDGRICYYGRFEEGDFIAAYRELTRRYCAGEGAAVAEGATHTAEYLIGVNRREWNRVFDELTDPDLHVVSRSSSGFPDRSAAELRASYEDLCALVAWVRSWHNAEHWLSPAVSVSRHEREAMGRDGERYEWTRLIVGEFRDGRTTHLCEFDADDEAAAFAYAEDRVRRAEDR